MPKDYGRPFIRVTAFGTLYTTEQWQASLNIISSGEIPEPGQTVADGALTAWTTLFGTQVLSSRASLVGVKVARIGSNGLYTSPSPRVAYGPPGGTAAAGSGSPAPQTAIAVTLLGAQPRAAAGNGRFYLPLPSYALDATGRIAENQAQSVAQAGARLVNDLNAVFGGLVGIVGAATDTGRGPARQPVVAVRVGRVYDTIRSRRTSFPEEPVTSMLTVSETDPDAASVGGFGGGGGSF